VRAASERLEDLVSCPYLEGSLSKKRRVSMVSRLLSAIVIAAIFGLSACEKAEEPAAEQKAPPAEAAAKAGAEGKGVTEEAPEAATEEGEKASE
jgi:uncharacterized membrane protein